MALTETLEGIIAARATIDTRDNVCGGIIRGGKKEIGGKKATNLIDTKLKIDLLMIM